MAKKKATYEVIPDGDAPDLYALMRELRDAHHPELAQASICLAWRHNWKSDQDGRLILGQMKKASDLDRQLHSYDFVMLLNYEVWKSVKFSDGQKRALIDHELCHGAVALDDEGSVRYTPDGRIVYRIRKHTIEEFHEIVERHGQWKGDIQTFVERAMAAGVPEQMTLADGETVAGRVISSMMDHLENPGSAAAGIRKAVDALGAVGGVTISSGGRSVTLPSKPH